jgi:hypothetical protein
MQKVDFKKYADIIVNLQMNNKYYFLIKKFDDDTLDHIRDRFDRESSMDFINRFDALSDEILKLQKENVPQESEQCQQLTKAYWDLIMEFTNGDMSMLQKLPEIANFENTNTDWAKKQAIVNSYLEPALVIYFKKLGINNVGEEQQ